MRVVVAVSFTIVGRRKFWPWGRFMRVSISREEHPASYAQAVSKSRRIINVSVLILYSKLGHFYLVLATAFAEPGRIGDSFQGPPSCVPRAQSVSDIHI